MLTRIPVALALALLASLATASVSFAAEHNPDLEEVAIGTFLVALATMTVLLSVYLVKHAFGLDRQLPPESPDEQAGHGGH